MGYIICTQKKFNSLSVAALDYIRKEFKSNADKWCRKLVHEDGRIAFIVKDRILPILESEKIVTLTDDWFPVEPIEL